MQNREIKKLEGRIANIKEELAVLKKRWEEEKALISQVKDKKNLLENLRFQEEEAERKADFQKVAELRYSRIPALQKEIDEVQKTLKDKAKPPASRRGG